MHIIFDLVYALLTFGNYKSYSYRNPNGSLKNEGEIYETDPLMVMLVYGPIIGGLCLSPFASWWWFGLLGFAGVATFFGMFHMKVLPIATGVILMIWGYFMGGWIGACSPLLVGWGLTIWAYFGYNGSPETLIIRKFLGKPEFFMNTWVLTADFMDWETIPGLQVMMRSDGTSKDSIKSMMRLIVEGSDRSNVAITFSGSILFRIELKRPTTVLVAFFDDFRLRPKEDDMTDGEDLEMRCNRLFRSIVTAACDTILQGLDWEVAINDIAQINRRLEEELPRHLHDFPIVVQKVLLEEAFGEPITQRSRQSLARLEATTATRMAEAERDRRQAVATADAEAQETEADQSRRARLAQATAQLTAGTAEQQTTKGIAIAQLDALGPQADVAQRQAQIATAPLVARLNAINSQQSAAVLDALVSLEPPQRLEVLRQLAQSLGTAPVPGTIVSVANGEGLDAFQAPALLDALRRIIGGIAPPPTST